jgi:tRNA threonylcarbamoyladenosine biosynthesis protein TsaE
MPKVITKNEKETFKLAKDFAKQLKGGEIIAMTGDLGAGKTAFTKGLAAGLSIKNIITSPTFVLMKNYPIKNNSRGINQLVHIDAYRLNNGQDLENFGGVDYFKDTHCVTVIEWAERVKDILPAHYFQLQFNINKQNSREIIIKHV